MLHLCTAEDFGETFTEEDVQCTAEDFGETFTEKDIWAIRRDIYVDNSSGLWMMSTLPLYYSLIFAIFFTMEDFA